MDRLPKFPAPQLVERMRGEFEQLMTQVAQAVNDAAAGRVIVDSEERVRDLLGEFRRSTYQTALQLRVDAAEAVFFPVDPASQQPKADKGRSGHRILTVNSHVWIARRHYYSPGEGTSTPSDGLLDAVEATVSLGVREMCCRVNADAKSFERAAANLKRTAQLTLSDETLRTIVEGDGKLVLQLSESGDLLPAWKGKQCLGPDGRSLVYLSSDGFMVPLITHDEKVSRRQKVLSKRRVCHPKRRALAKCKRGADQRYKEFKAVMFYDHTMEHRLVSVTRGNCDAAGRLMRRDAGRIGFAAVAARVGNIDGGPWIIGQIQRRHLPMTATGLDFYHLGENVHKARRVIFGEEDKAGENLAGELLHTVKHQGYQPLWEKLLALRKQCRGSAQRKAADGLLHYVAERREMIRYPEFLAHGWQIGSGPMESQCRVVPDRVKGAGKRWDADHAEAVMQFEALKQGRQWSDFWQAALQHEYGMN